MPSPNKPATDSTQRLSTLRRLLADGEMSTQEELVSELKRLNFSVTQSTISRDLRRLGAIKAQDTTGRTVYKLPSEYTGVAPIATGGLKGLIVDIQHNGSMIVVHTPPGSASLVARHLDQTKPAGLLGTIAGDDTIFVAPVSSKRIDETMKAILEEMS